jgi:hypothetical protein
MCELGATHMNPETKTKYRRYDKTFKRSAVEHWMVSGKPATHVATELGKLGVKVMVTELDLDVLPAASRNRSADVSLRFAQNPALDPYNNGIPPAIQQAFNNRYASLFALYVKHTQQSRGPGDVLGRDRRWFLAQQLADQRPHKLSAPLRPRG